MKKRLNLLMLLMALYLVSYGVFRFTHMEKWDYNGETYVIFPENQSLIYYFYRPATLVDGQLTNMRFHIGPHRGGVE